MTPTEKERFYDEHIAPKLMAIGKECEEAGLSFVAVCEFKPGETGGTYTLQADAGIGIRVVRWAGHANGNVDALFIAIGKHARKHGHSSMHLLSMGIPETPRTEDVE